MHTQRESAQNLWNMDSQAQRHKPRFLMFLEVAVKSSMLRRQDHLASYFPNYCSGTIMRRYKIGNT